MLILNERQLQRVLKEYVTYFNTARPHQGIGGQIPIPDTAAAGRQLQPGRLRHFLCWAACIMIIAAAPEVLFSLSDALSSPHRFW